MLHNTEKAVEILKGKGSIIKNYTVAPIVKSNGNGYHRWIVEGELKKDAERKLDEILCTLNSDYSAKREGDMILENLKIIEVEEGYIEKIHVECSQRESVQSKTPKLLNNTSFQEKIIQYLSLEM